MTPRPKFLLVLAAAAFFSLAPFAMADAVFSVHPAQTPVDNIASFHSLEAALEASRLEPGRRSIKIAPGEYFFSESVVLDKRDNGLEISGPEDGKATLYGGEKITDWIREGDVFVSGVLDKARDGRWDFRSLVVNGRLADRSRMPAAGYYLHLSRFDSQWLSTTDGGWSRKPRPEELVTMRCKPRDLGGWFDPANAEVTVYHKWDETLARVKSIDRKNCELVFESPLGHPPGAFGVRKYVVWNSAKGLTRPGQWRLDKRSGRIHYRPLPGEEMSELQVAAPAAESVIKLRGAEGASVKDVKISGLTISATNTPVITGGYGARAFSGAVDAGYAENCVFEDLVVKNAGGQGIKAWGEGLEIRGCQISNTGACGIRFWGEDSIAENNLIHDTGRIYPSAIALWGGKMGIGNLTIAHNEVRNSTYTAIAATGDGARISGNLIFNAVKEMKDGGGIYITFCRDAVVRGNVVRGASPSRPMREAAFYLDEQAENCLVQGNLAVDCMWPLHVHMARDNIIKNNVFSSEKSLKITFPKSGKIRLEKNIASAAGEASVKFTKENGWAENNIFFGRPANISWFGGRNMIAPPMIIIKDNSVDFSPQSPARRLGLKAPDLKNVGIPHAD